jgi:hypothetical protein
LAKDYVIMTQNWEHSVTEKRKRRPEKTLSDLPQINGSESIKVAGRRAKTTTQRLCELYVSLTQTMDPSLVKYYLQHSDLQKRLKKATPKGTQPKT